MLNSVTVTLDLGAIQQKLTSYFSNSCPVEVSLEISALGVIVTDKAGKSISVPFMQLPINDYIEEIVKACERELYLKICKTYHKKRFYSVEEMKALLLRGRSLNDLYKGVDTVEYEVYILRRVSIPQNTLIIESDKHSIKAVLFKPIQIALEELTQLSEQERYEYITKNALIGEIDVVR